ncbi:ABC transport system permease protein [Corynebacterium resistens DSM 45100]|uniref:ABC transport system permease protein n=1 Tax=Corynebacterium resistens (strain DSM 45100 / JCM 12819 / GTC 2026 / SICGH 158) TaxID=662755 RepID=F8E1L2_CORRG|nr:ABC transporter permease [Corynebacterium resistens]AEI08517.1 ABC transport system permease protein [Corynebacterium resistens DSM 45100]
MLNVINSEWIKLRTTKSLAWTTGLVLFFSLGMALLMGGMTGYSLANDPGVKKDPELYAILASGISVDSAINGLTLIGMMIIIIQAVMFVTGEYGSNVSKPTLLATPKRVPVPFAKLLVYGVFATVLTFITSLLSVVAMRWAVGWNLDNPQLMEQLDFNGDAWTIIGRLCLKVFLVVALSIGVGYLLRHTAGSIALLLLWPLLVEGLLVSLLPKIKDWLPPYMPFNNIDEAISLREVVDAPWGQIGSIIYFAAWAVAIFVAGVIVLQRRDA